MSDFLDDLARIGRKAVETGQQRLSARERILYCVDTLNYELLCGEWEQYFDSEAGNLALDAVAALHTIGATETARLLSAACARFPDGGPSANREVRQLQVKKLPKDCFSGLTFSEEEGTLMELLETWWRTDLN